MKRQLAELLEKLKIEKENERLMYQRMFEVNRKVNKVK
jgi:hypothetical protein